VGKKIITFIILLAISAGQLIAQQAVIKKSSEKRVLNGKEYFIHRVEQGQTLYSIARVYEVTVNELIVENQGADKGLAIGRELKIPVKSRDAVVKESYGGNNLDFFYHIVKNGDNFEKIARIYSVAVDHLKMANRAVSEPLKTGQYIKIPVVNNTPETQNADPKPAPSASVKEQEEPLFISYKILQGDNLYRIALKFNVSIEEIKKMNPGLTDRLVVGMNIRIPNKKNKTTFINHKVQKRERLTQIAKNYAVELDEIQQLNPYVRSRPQSGQIVKIPTGYIEEKIEKPEMTASTEEKTESADENRDSLRCYSDRQNMLRTYHVALMIPLYLEQVDSLKFDPEYPQVDLIDEDPFQFLSFYYGMLMAIDSLKNKGLKINLFVYDVDDNTEKAIQVLNQPELKQMDMIIGPFFSSIFPIASGFAKKYNIPIINPLTRRSEIVQNNSNVFKFQPTESYQIEDVNRLVDQNFRDSKIFLLAQQSDAGLNPLNAYTELIRQQLPNEFRVPNTDIHNLILEKSATDTSLIEGEIQPLIRVEGQLIYTEEIELHLEDSSSFSNRIIPILYSRDTLGAFESNASVFRNNLVIIHSEDNVFALDVLTKLNILRDTFPVTVIGLPDWERFDIDKMDIEIYKSLNTHYFSSTFVDYKDRDVNAFLAKYRSLFLSEPENYAFTGFDIGWYFFNALFSFGKDFQECLAYYHPKMIHSGITFRKMDRRDGFENVHWEILKFNNYQLQKVPILVNPN